MGCAGSASNKYDESKVDTSTVEAATYPSGEWRVEESPEEWTPVEQEFPRFLVWESEEPPYLVFRLHEKLQEIGQQLLEAYFNGQLEASYVLPTGNFHVDFYGQLQTHQETGRQCRIAWFDTSAVTTDGTVPGMETEEMNSINPEVYLGGEWLLEDADGVWVRLDHEISAQLLVAWYCGEQVLDYSDSQNQSFQVDLTVWEQRNIATGQKKRIVWNSSDASSEGDAGLAESWADSQETTADSSTWLDPGEEAERQLFAALNSGQPVVRYTVNGSHFEVDVVNMVQTNLSTGERWMIAVEEGAAEVRLVKGGKNSSNNRMPPKVPEPGHSEVPKAEEATQVQPETTAFVGGASEPRQVSTAKGGRPKAFIYKAVPNNDRLEADYSETLGSSQLDWSRPPPKQKKWSLAPGQKPRRLAPKATPKSSSAPKTGAGQAGTGAGAKEQALPPRVEWPKGPKARRVAEAVYADMRKSREKPLAHRRRAYMAMCLSWHPDKNLKHQEVATEVFQFLQAVKEWYFGEI
eukprot:symbB.v1.2.037549.t1/scaffold5574.1/size49343/4